MLLVEGPGNAEFTGAAGGQLLGALVESQGTAAAEGHAPHNVAVVLLEHRLSGGAAPDVLLNITAEEQARPGRCLHDLRGVPGAVPGGTGWRCVPVSRLCPWRDVSGCNLESIKLKGESVGQLLHWGCFTSHLLCQNKHMAPCWPQGSTARLVVLSDRCLQAAVSRRARPVPSSSADAGSVQPREDATVTRRSRSQGIILLTPRKSAAGLCRAARDAERRALPAAVPHGAAGAGQHRRRRRVYIPAVCGRNGRRGTGDDRGAGAAAAARRYQGARRGGAAGVRQGWAADRRGWQAACTAGHCLVRGVHRNAPLWRLKGLLLEVCCGAPKLAPCMR